MSMQANPFPHVSLGKPNPTSQSFHISRSSKRAFEDVVISLREAIAFHGLRLLNEIDPQRAVAGIGKSIPGSRLLFFFHPALVVRVMEMDPTAMLEAPLKLVISELPDGLASIRIADPSVTFSRYGNPSLAQFGQEMAGICMQIIDAAV